MYYEYYYSYTFWWGALFVMFDIPILHISASYSFTIVFSFFASFKISNIKYDKLTGKIKITRLLKKTNAILQALKYTNHQRLLNKQCLEQ